MIQRHKRGIQFVFGRYPDWVGPSSSSPTSSMSSTKNNHKAQTNASPITSSSSPPTMVCKPKLVYSSKIVFPTKHGGVQPGACSINHEGIIDGIYPDITLDTAKDIATQRNLQWIPPLDGADTVLSPGLMDVHCHISELGRDWEGYHTATRSAAAGGITTLMGMPF